MTNMRIRLDRFCRLGIAALSALVLAACGGGNNGVANPQAATSLVPTSQKASSVSPTPASAGTPDTWTTVSPVTTSSRYLAAAATNGTLYVAVGSSGTQGIVFTSNEISSNYNAGKNWTAHGSVVKQPLLGITWSAHLSEFIAVGNAGTILTSPDGVTWTHQHSGTTSWLGGIVSTDSQLVAVGGSGTILTSPDGINWTAQNSGSSNSLYAAAWSGSQFVAVGDSGTILTSPDGAAWTIRNSSAPKDNLYGATYGGLSPGSQFVVVGDSGTVLTSTDGVSWTVRASGTSNPLYGAAWSINESQFVAVGGFGTVMTSPDGVTWTSAQTQEPTTDNLFGITPITSTNSGNGGSPMAAVGAGYMILTSPLTSPDDTSWANQTPATTNRINGIAWSGSEFVAVGDSGTILRSPDGLSWTGESSEYSGITGNLNGVAWSGSVFVAVDADGGMYSSTDGKGWNFIDFGVNSKLKGIAWSGTQFVVVGTNGEIVTSPDGSNWTTQSSGTSNSLYGIAWSGGQFIAVGDAGTILTSPDGVTWTARTSGTSNTLYAIAGSGSRFIAVGAGGAILTSPDGATWTVQPSLDVPYLDGIAWSATLGGFVAVGDLGTLFTSPDGATWTAQTSGTKNPLYGVAYSGGRFVAVGDSATIISSPDGNAWATQSAGTANWLYGIDWSGNVPILSSNPTGTNALLGAAWSGSQFVAVGYFGAILTSPDGLTWTPRSSGTTHWLMSVTWSGTRFVAAGDAGTILTSPDGVTWTPQDSSTTESLLAIAWSGSQFVAVGASGTILTSPDGVTWKARSSPTTNALFGVASSGSQFVAVGASGTILTSPDGVTWTQDLSSPTTNALNSVTWSGTQFMAVGDAGTVLTSPDGATWTQDSSLVSDFAIDALNSVTWSPAGSGGWFVAVGNSGTVIAKNQGTGGWLIQSENSGSANTSGTSNTLYGIASSGSRFVAVGNSGTLITTDLASLGTSPWVFHTQGRTQPVTDRLNDIAWSGSRFVAVGDLGTILTALSSPNGLRWVAANSGTTNLLYGVVWSGSQFVAVGDAGTILTSPDAMTWTKQNSGIASRLYDIAWSGSRFVAVGEAGIVLTSPDGVTWTQQPSGTTNTLYSVTWSGTQFVAVGDFGKLLASPDGVTWTTQTSGTSSTLNAVTWSGSQFIAVGDAGAIVTSSDGKAWTARSSGTTKALDGVTWSGTRFLAAGESGTVLTSSDGVTWTPETSNTTNVLSAIAWSGSRFVAVGGAGTIVASSTSNLAPDGTIDTPSADVTFVSKGSVNFTGTGADPDSNTPLSYLWDFGSAAPNSTQEDPGNVTFNTPGTYFVTLTVTDALGLSDPTPATRRITVKAAIGGTVSGLTGTLVLANGSDSVTLSANGGFTFPTAVTNGTSYNVTVASPPPGQTCSVTNGVGTVDGANVTNVAVSCVTNYYTIGGTVSGLTGTVVLANGSDSVSLSTNGGFTFPTSVVSGAGYNVTVTTQPAGQICSVTNGTGTVASANITNVTVTCVSIIPFTWMGGSNTVNAIGSYGTGTVASAEMPGAREDAASWTDANGNVWLFGGSVSAFGVDGPYLNDLWRYNPTTNQWTWMGGSSTEDAAGTYGTLGVAASTNMPGARAGAASWVDANGNFWLFGGHGFGSSPNSWHWLNDLWRYSPTTQEWTWMGGSSTLNANTTFGTLGVAASTNMPGAREGVASWTDANGDLWMFGGTGTGPNSSTNGNLNELWRYNPTTNQWTWMGGQGGVFYTPTLGVPSSNEPEARAYAASWVDANGDFWMFGGNTFVGEINDLWRYNPTTNQWTWVGGTLSTSGSYTNGTYGSFGIPASTNVPGARADATFWVDANGNFWMFGGSQNSFGPRYGGPFFNDLWRYNPTTNQWTWMGGSSTQDAAGTYGTLGVAAYTNIPGSREGALPWTDTNGNVWLFGGAGYDSGGNTGDLNDLWRFHP